MLYNDIESKVFRVDEKLVINNKNIANYVMFKLDKLDNVFLKGELAQITELVIDYKEEDESSFVFLKELLKFNNIKSITLRNGYIYNDDYNIFLQLSNLSEIVFDNCEFENADLVASLNIKTLSLINCNINNYSFLNVFEHLEGLTIINGTVEINKINTLKELKYLQLSYSKILDNTQLNLNDLIELYIDNTNIYNLEFLGNLFNLKRLSIDSEQYNKNKDIVQELLAKNILVLNENMVEFVE